MPWTTFDTKIGTCGIAWTDAGVRFTRLPESSKEAMEERLATRFEGDDPSKAPKWIADAIKLMQAHLEGGKKDLSKVKIDFSDVSEFDRQIYEALRQVPSGTTVTYGDLAKSVGSPGAARAVGRAMGANPFPLLVPCQRVVGSNGKGGGFSAYGGVATKEKILALEGAPSPSLFSTAAPSLPYDRKLACDHLIEADKLLGAHIGTVGDFTLALKDTEGVFDALAESIVYQQLNGKAAATIFGRVRALFPRQKLDAKKLLALDEEKLRGAGLSKNKLASLQDLADKTLAGTIPTLAQLNAMTDDAIVEKLTLVRGIGRWTVEMLLIFRLGRPDVLPVADYGVKKGYARLFHKGKLKDQLPDAEAMMKRGERWRPFRSVASWYLWRAADS